MPIRPDRICSCGKRVKSGTLCECERRRAAERKARHDQNRPSARERGYTTAWQKARAAFLKLHPFCEKCGGEATIVDHIIPHRGDQARFWDRHNWQPLCTPCHSSAKQREERRAS